MTTASELGIPYEIPAFQSVQKLRKSRAARKTTHWHGKYPPFLRFFCHSGACFFSVIPAFFHLSFRRKPESRANTARNAHITAPDGPPLPSWDISAKEREARAFYAGFRLSPE